MKRCFRRVATFVLLLLTCQCGSGEDTYVVLHSDVNCDVPRVYQLRVTISSGGATDQKTIPESPDAEMGFPSSLTLVMSGSRSGTVDVVVEAIDSRRQVVGFADTTGSLVAGGRIDLQVQLIAQTPGAAAVVGGDPARPKARYRD